MPDWQSLFDTETAQRVALIGSFLGGAGFAVWRLAKGLREGRPTSAAVAHAVAQATPTCRIGDATPAFEAVRADIAALREEMGEMRDLLIKIEDRTRGL